MQYEVSCGGVVFTRQENEIYFVIVQSLEGYYGFPKGHTEGQETEEQTAVREIFEEIGLAVKLLPGFRTVDEHSVPYSDDIIKRCVYFAAEYEDQEIVCQQEELRSADLMTYEQAMAAFQFESSKRILKEAYDYLVKYKKEF